MINLLEFETLHEYKHAWNTSARSLFLLYTSISNCLILYKYKLPMGIEVPKVLNKFGTGNADRITYEKLIGDSIILFHLDVFKSNPEKIRYLMDWCLMNDIDLYIPMINFNSKWYSFRTDNDHFVKIDYIISEYQVKKYDLKEIKYNRDSEIQNAIFEKMKPLLRDIKIRRLLL